MANKIPKLFLLLVGIFIAVIAVCIFALMSHQTAVIQLQGDRNVKMGRTYNYTLVITPKKSYRQVTVFAVAPELKWSQTYPNISFTKNKVWKKSISLNFQDFSKLNKASINQRNFTYSFNVGLNSPYVHDMKASPYFKSQGFKFNVTVPKTYVRPAIPTYPPNEFSND